MDSGKQKDSYVSIQADVQMDWRRLPEEDIEGVIETFSERSAAIGICSEIEYNKELLAPAARRIKKDHPDIASWLAVLQKTVESLALQVSLQRNSQSNLSARRVSISAAGIEFDSSRHCEIGDKIEIVLMLQPSLTNIMIVGDVENIQPLDGDSDSRPDSCRMKVNFSLIRDSDQEVLIRHIHRAQIDELRNARANRQEKCEDPLN